jgi:hypothetical protein
MADAIRHFFAGCLCPIPQRQRLLNSIHRTRSCNALSGFCQTKMVACCPALDVNV